MCCAVVGRQAACLPVQILLRFFPADSPRVTPAIFSNLWCEEKELQKLRAGAYNCALAFACIPALPHPNCRTIQQSVCPLHSCELQYKQPANKQLPNKRIVYTPQPKPAMKQAQPLRQPTSNIATQGHVTDAACCVYPMVQTCQQRQTTNAACRNESCMSSTCMCLCSSCQHPQLQRWCSCPNSHVSTTNIPT